MWEINKEYSELKQYTILLFNEAKLYLKENELKKIADSSDCVNLVYNDINKLKAFKHIFDEPRHRKSNKESDILRIKGNDYFLRDKNYFGALVNYTKSIASAVNGSSYMALAYANRSACLFKRQYYKECLEDIDRALSVDYPENLKPKLLTRKAAAESKKCKPKQVRYYNDPPVIKSKNPLRTYAEDSIEIQHNKKYGRHIIATRNIKIGEVLSAENSFCHVVHPESKYLHCHECLELCFNMIPCENCCTALYCSEECRSKCYEEYHKYTCQFPKILLFPETVFIKLALIGMENSKKTEAADLPNNIHKSDPFTEIIKLEVHAEDCNYIEQYVSAIVASIVYHALKENKEFSSKYDTDDDDHNIKKLLYEAHRMNRFNAFAIEKICLKSKNLQIYSTVGIALYAFSSLYNHSCVPNCELDQYGSLMVVRAIEDIQKGEQVTISYGNVFGTTPKATRQAQLKENYLFDCDCKACTHNWPTMNKLPLGNVFPLSFLLNCTLIVESSETNQKLEDEILTTGKTLCYQLKNCEPCKNLLKVQNIITLIYRRRGNRIVEF